MTSPDGHAARYFPFRDTSDAERLIRKSPDTDRTAQTRTARHASILRRVRAATRPLWYSPILIAATIGTDYLWLGISVTAVCVIAIPLLNAAANHARREIRLADATIGIPLPDDLVVKIMGTGKAMHRINDLYDRAEEDLSVYEKVRQNKRQIDELDQRYVAHLQRARRQWVAGDLPMPGR